MGRIAEDAKVEANILLIDIERQAGLTHRFDQRGPEFVPVSRWVRLPSFLCFAAKHHGKRDMEFHAAWDDPEAMVERSWHLYDQAQIVITYNGRRFDNKHLRTAWRDQGLPPPTPWKDVDLFTVNKAQFGAESYSLQHLCHQLGLPGKSGHYDPMQADLCMEGDQRARSLMERYNRGDVRILENAYDALLPWIYNHPHVTVDPDNMRCNRCAGASFTPLVADYLAQVNSYRAYRCDRCGGISRSGNVRRVAATRGIQ